MKALANEFKGKWKEIISLFFICSFELFPLSSAFNKIPLGLAVAIALIIALPAIVLIILSIKDKMRDKKELKVLLLFLLGALFCGIAKSYLYIISIVVAYLFYGDKNKLYKWMFLASASAMIVFFLLVIIGIYPNQSWVRFDDFIPTNIRHSLGFSNPNHPLKFVMSTIIWGYLWLGITRKKTLIFSLLMLAIALFVGYTTNCRTGIYTILLLIIMMNCNFFTKFIKAEWIIPSFVAITILLVICSDIGFINSMLNGRPEWFAYYFETEYKHIFFGKAYHKLFNTDYPLDNDFMYILFDGGLLVLVLNLIIFYKAFKGEKNPRVLISIIAVCVYSLTEVLALLFINPLYVLAFTNLIEKFKNDNVQIGKEKSLINC